MYAIIQPNPKNSTDMHIVGFGFKVLKFHFGTKECLGQFALHVKKETAKEEII